MAVEDALVEVHGEATIMLVCSLIPAARTICLHVAGCSSVGNINPQVTVFHALVHNPFVVGVAPCVKRRWTWGGVKRNRVMLPVWVPVKSFAILDKFIRS